MMDLEMHCNKLNAMQIIVIQISTNLYRLVEKS